MELTESLLFEMIGRREVANEMLNRKLGEMARDLRRAEEKAAAASATDVAVEAPAE